MAFAQSKQYAHELIERMAPRQVLAVVTVMEKMLDPVASALAKAPIDDELVSEDEAQEIAASRLAGEKVVSHEELLAEFGLSIENFETMGRTPLPPETNRAGL